LHEIFIEGWQWANEQMFKFCWQSGSRIRMQIYMPDLCRYRDTGKTCLGGGMYCPCASSFL